MICTIVKQLTRGLTTTQIEEAGLDAYFTDHTLGIFPANAAGDPFTAAYIQSVGDPIADLSEDLAADAAISQVQASSEERRKPL